MQIAKIALVVCFTMLSLGAPTQAQPETRNQRAHPEATRTVAVTIDDLPVVRGRNLARMQQITTGLLGHLTAYQIPAIGFVNEQKLGLSRAKPERVALLEQWLEAGFDLGNHTYSHPKFYDTPLADFEADLLRGEVVTTRLLSKRPQQLQYFRHPYLNTGPDLQTKAAFEQFLAEQGYVVAPVTIDNDEFIYALAYDRAVEANEESVAARVGADYVRYMEEMFVFYEQLSRDLIGREPAQILLLHANALNAAYLDELVEMMQARGYRFITLGSALEDPVYALPDEYIGSRGLSWLQRWWITQGNAARAEPRVPAWVRKTAYPNRD